MRITIDHRTHYAFTEPQSRVVQALRLSPDDTNDQTVVAWRIDVDCDARLRSSRDGLGNRVTMLYAEGPLDSIEICVQGEVLTSDTNGFVTGADEPLPPAFYLRDTEHTLAGPDLTAFMLSLRGEAAAGAALVDRVTAAMAERFVTIEPVDDPLRDARAVFAETEASGREQAQLLVAGLRAIGAPARYVSGYRLGSGERCSPHGWVEAFTGSAGWLAVDPSAGSRIDERYVRVAIGLDIAEAAPVAGSRLGAGEEALDVALRVARASGDA